MRRCGRRVYGVPVPALRRVKKGSIQLQEQFLSIMRQGIYGTMGDIHQQGVVPGNEIPACGANHAGGVEEVVSGGSEVTGSADEGRACVLRRCCKLLGKEAVDVGSVVVVQTAGRSGSYNPHLHIICTSGGICDGKWKGFGYIDYNIMHRKWQYHLLGMLKEEVKTSEMAEAVDRCWRKYPKGFVSYIEKGEVPEDGKGLAYYLAKYVVSPPISLRRIISYNGHKVRYWYNDHATGRMVDEEVDAKGFIGRMVQHILPKGFQRIRYYGLQATCRASKIRDKLLVLMKSRGEESRDTYTVTGNGYRNRIKKSFGVDPIICGACGQEMEFEGVWHPEYGWIIDNWNSFFMKGELVTGYG